MAANDRLVIFRGDDTGGAFGRRLSFVITAAEGVSLDGCRAEWVFDGIVKEFAAPIVSGEEREIFYSHNETRCMRPGVRFGTFRIVDAAGKVRTFDNTRPVEVTDSVSRCYPGSSSATVFVGTTVSWDQVSGKPPLVKTINGEPPDADGNIDVASGGTVKSATVNGGKKVVPTADGNLALTVPSSVESVNSKTGAVRLMAKDIPYNDEGDTTEEAVDGLATVVIRHTDDESIHVSSSDRAEWADKYTRTEVDEKINEFAAHYLTADAAGNAFATAAALKSATAYYYAGATHTPDKNDYCIVRADEDHKTAAGISPTTRYFYVGDVTGDGQWVYAYTINETALTQAQIAALDSGITASKVAEFDAKQNALSDAQLANIDAVPQKRDKDDLFMLWETESSAFAVVGQPVKVYSEDGYRYLYSWRDNIGTEYVTRWYDVGMDDDPLEAVFGSSDDAFTATRKRIATEDQIPDVSNKLDGPTDETLNIDGAAADARVVGDKLAEKAPASVVVTKADRFTEWECTGTDSANAQVKWMDDDDVWGLIINGRNETYCSVPRDATVIEPGDWEDEYDVRATRSEVAYKDEIAEAAADACKVMLPYALVTVDETHPIADRSINTTTSGTFVMPKDFTDLLIRFEGTPVGIDWATNGTGITDIRGDDIPSESGDYLITITRTKAAEAYVRVINIAKE